jgi:adenylyltransferase/sulfurtransferase
VGSPKASAAADRLTTLNSDITVRPVVARLVEANAAAILGGHHAVVEGSDNLATKFLVNDVCVRLGIGVVVGAVLRYEGQVVSVPPGAACYRCLFGAEPPSNLVGSCRDAGVLGAVAGMVGSLQATETLRMIVGIGDAQGGKLLALDALRPRLRAIPFPADPACTACAQRPAPAATTA